MAAICMVTLNFLGDCLLDGSSRLKLPSLIFSLARISLRYIIAIKIKSPEMINARMKMYKNGIICAKMSPILRPTIRTGTVMLTT